MFGWTNIFGQKTNFEGISKEGMDKLVDAIKGYCNKIEGKINEFNANADLTESVKGTNLQPAVQNYVKAIKELLAAYVSTMRRNVDFAQKAYQDYEQAEKAVAKSVQSNAQQVRNTAAGIKLN